MVRFVFRLVSFGALCLAVIAATMDSIASVSASQFAWLLPQPAFAVLLSLSLIFWMIGYRKPSPAGRFAA